MEMNEGKTQAHDAGCGDAAVKTREEQIRDKARELGQTYFPDSANIWARSNVEAAYVENACVEMAEWVDRHPAWISVEDELPKADGRYIIADKYGGVEQMNFDAESKYWWLRGTGRMSDFVTHWMPKPVPPAPEKEED